VFFDCWTLNIRMSTPLFLMRGLIIQLLICFSANV